MFRHLRNRLIIINLAVTSMVLVLAFSAIYVVALGEAHRCGSDHPRPVGIKGQ